MKVGELRKLIEDVPDDANIHFDLGDHESHLDFAETWVTSTKDAAFVVFDPPKGWERV